MDRIFPNEWQMSAKRRSCFSSWLDLDPTWISSKSVFFFHEDEWVSARITAVWSADLFAHELDVIICYSLR